MEIVLFAIIMFFLGLLAFLYYQLLQRQKETEKDQEKHVPTTQDSLPLDYIRGGVVKIKSGGYRVLIELPSINIDLMEASEKETVLQQYRQILNSVDFPFQYLQQSRIVDISEYLNKLEFIRINSKDKFTKSQLEYYSTYLKDLIKNRSILTKRFYLVIPYDEHKEKANSRRQQYSAYSRTQNKRNKKTIEEDDLFKEEQEYERARKVLMSRATQVERSFRRFGIKPHILSDNELLELYYTSYNKDRSVYQTLREKNPADFTTFRVKAAKGGKPK